MTRFHDRVLALDPIVFVPFDGPADDATHAYDLVSGGHLAPGVGGTRSDAPDDMAFTKELVLNGTTQYWVANSTLLDVLSTWLATAPRFATSVQWWRTTQTAGTRYLHRFSNGGFGIYLDLSGYNKPLVMLIDESNTERTAITSTFNNAVTTGGWQLAGLRFHEWDVAFPLNKSELVNLFNTNYFSLDTYFDRQGIRRNTPYKFEVGRGASGSDYYDGSLGPLAIFDRHLDIVEYEEFYNASLGTQPTQALLAWRSGESRLRTDAAWMRTI